MTTDIERQFFEAFGIEPKYDRMLCDNDYQCNGECNKCEHQEDDNKHKFYPQITDRILLELICINAKSQDMYQDYYRIRSRNYNNLKIEILGDCMCEREDIKQQVQALFKEG